MRSDFVVNGEQLCSDQTAWFALMSVEKGDEAGRNRYEKHNAVMEWQVMGVLKPIEI